MDIDTLLRQLQNVDSKTIVPILSALVLGLATVFVVRMLKKNK